MEDYQEKLLEIESQSAELLAALDSLGTESAAYARSENKLTSTSEQLAQLIDSTKKSIIETQNLIRVTKEMSGPEIINYLNEFSSHVEAINASLVSIKSDAETKLQKLQAELDAQSAKANRYLAILTVFAAIIIILQVVILLKG